MLFRSMAFLGEALNTSLQGKDAVVSQLCAHNKVFATKLQLFHRCLLQNKPNMTHFPLLQEVVDNFPSENDVRHVGKYATAVASLSEEFYECFHDFTQD